MFIMMFILKTVAFFSNCPSFSPYFFFCNCVKPLLWKVILKRTSSIRFAVKRILLILNLNTEF